MKALAPNLFTRNFEELVAMGRARLPSLAPVWTDHNAHDPGITVMELLAFVAEAQLYALSRSRRDERAAYAALMGIQPAGAGASQGLIWSDRGEAASPAATFESSVVIPADREIHVVNAEVPTFRPTDKVLWAPGRLVRLETRLANGAVVDHTSINDRGGPSFLPFGERAGRRDVLRLTFRCHGGSFLSGVTREETKGARWTIGVRAADSVGVRCAGGCLPLAATLLRQGERVPVRIVSDTTAGFLATGALLLDLDDIDLSAAELTVELRSRGAFDRPPRVVRIEPNVVPIRQGHAVEQSVEAREVPDWSFDLSERELRFSPGQESVTVEIADKTGTTVWKRCERLADHGPDDTVYELDTARNRITFGNGINGRIPRSGASVHVSYCVSDGERGNVARNRKWMVAGFSDVFGVNLDPVSGGAKAVGWLEQRRDARRHSREDHALVSSADIIAAADSIPLLEVRRAWIAHSGKGAPRTGTVTLVAMRDGLHETQAWLEAIRRRLAPRIPLGTRFVVTAPRYVGFTFDATVEASLGRNPEDVKKAIDAELRKRLDVLTRPPGLAVTSRDLTAWIRGVDGVHRLVGLRLIGASGRTAAEVAVPATGLPRGDFAGSTITVNRRPTGASR